MPFVPAPSPAMDATAASGGPSTFLPQIVTGNSEMIFKHIEEVLQKAQQFGQLIQQFEEASKQLEQAWSGDASQSALKKIESTLQSFQKIVQVLEEGASLLGISGTLVQTAQTSYNTVVSAVNPTVASLMSNPWTYSAAVALSTSTSATLRGFIQAIGAALQALGAGQLAQKIMQLATIIGDIEKLFGNTQQQGSGLTGTNASQVGSTPVVAPQQPQSVATAAGQTAAGGATTDGGASAAALQNATQAAQTATGGQTTQLPFTDYVPPALQGVAQPTGGGATPSLSGGGTAPTLSSTGVGAVPSLSGSGSGADGWIPVDHAGDHTGATPTGSAPVTSDAATHDVTVTATKGDLTATVEVPAGKETDINLDVSSGDQQIHEHAHVGADGSVSLS